MQIAATGSFNVSAETINLLDAETDFGVVEKYCISKNIQPVLPLYEEMFAVGAGFLTRAKMLMYMSEEWIQRFPD